MNGTHLHASLPDQCPTGDLDRAVAWEAPVDWLVFLGLTALILSCMVLMYWKIVGAYETTPQRTRFLSLVTAGLVCLIPLVFVSTLVQKPFEHRLTAWIYQPIDACAAARIAVSDRLLALFGSVHAVTSGIFCTLRDR
jgi:hypothetical protein